MHQILMQNNGAHTMAVVQSQIDLAHLHIKNCSWAGRVLDG